MLLIHKIRLIRGKTQEMRTLSGFLDNEWNNPFGLVLVIRILVWTKRHQLSAKTEKEELRSSFVRQISSYYEVIHHCLTLGYELPSFPTSASAANRLDDASRFGKGRRECRRQ